MSLSVDSVWKNKIVLFFASVCCIPLHCPLWPGMFIFNLFQLVTLHSSALYNVAPIGDRSQKKGTLRQISEVRDSFYPPHRLWMIRWKKIAGHQNERKKQHSAPLAMQKHWRQCHSLYLVDRRAQRKRQTLPSLWFSLEISSPQQRQQMSFSWGTSRDICEGILQNKSMSSSCRLSSVLQTVKGANS